jgi:hypothetical protein
VLGVLAALSKLEDIQVEQMDGVREDIVFRLPPELRDRTDSSATVDA